MRKIACRWMLAGLCSAMALPAHSLDYTLVVPVAVYLPADLNACDNRVWSTKAWGNTTTLRWARFHGQAALQASFVSIGGTEAYICTDFFSPENWSAVTQVQVDVYVENGKSNMGLRLEMDDTNSGYPPIFSSEKSSGSIPAGSGETWTTVTWAVSPSLTVPVSQIFFVPTNMATGDSVCFRNMRIRRSGVDETWELFNTPGYTWQGMSDFTPWQTNGERNEPVSHNRAYTGSTAGALCIRWSTGQSTDPFAKMQAMNLHYHNFSAIQKFRAWVYSDQTNAPIYMGFWRSDGSQWVETDRKTVTNANQWQQLEWDRPAGSFDWNHPENFSFIIQTDLGPASGTVYIDAIEFVP